MESTVVLYQPTTYDKAYLRELASALCHVVTEMLLNLNKIKGGWGPLIFVVWESESEVGYLR